MTLEELLECSAIQLKALTDTELLAHFEPMFKVTRPELAEKPQRKASVKEDFMSPDEANQLNLNIMKLKAMGIEIDRNQYLKKMRSTR